MSTLGIPYVLTPRLYCCAIVGTIGSSMITGTTAATPSQMAFIGGLDPVKQAENMIQVGSHTHTYPHPLTLTHTHPNTHTHTHGRVRVLPGNTACRPHNAGAAERCWDIAGILLHTNPPPLRPLAALCTCCADATLWLIYLYAFLTADADEEAGDDEFIHSRHRRG